MSILDTLQRTLAQLALRLNRPHLFLGAAQIVAGLALLIGSEEAASVARQLFALGEGVAETGSLLGGLGLLLAGAATPFASRSRGPAGSGTAASPNAETADAPRT